jgi:hypothetical protein
LRTEFSCHRRDDSVIADHLIIIDDSQAGL